MDLASVPRGLASAVNREGAVVRSVEHELITYERGRYSARVQVCFPLGRVVAYEPHVPRPVPPDLTEAELRQELSAGVEAVVGTAVEW